MCLICLDYEKEKLTIQEGLRNLQEMKPIIGETHYWEVYNRLIDDQNDEMLDEWWEEFGFGD